MESIYQLYFNITARRPIGAIDWAIRRFLSVLFDDASSTADINMVKKLASYRNEACNELLQPDSGNISGQTELDICSVSSDQSLNQAFHCGQAPYILLARETQLPASDSIESLLKTCLAAPEAVAVWELSPTLISRRTYVDPITLDIPCSRMKLAIVRRSALDQTGIFDASLSQEEQALDMSYRLRANGYRLHNRTSSHLIAEDGSELSASTEVPRASSIAMRWIYSRSTSFLASHIGKHSGSMKNENERSADESSSKVSAQNLVIDRDVSSRPSRLWRKGSEINFGTFPDSPALDRKTCPLISIVIRTYEGRQHWLRESLCSALNQSYPRLEILVVEDGEVDGNGNMQDAIDSQAVNSNNGNQQHTVRYLSQEKKGKSSAGNLALAQAKGDYIGFLDDDDLLFPHHVESLYNVLLKNDTHLAAYGLAWEAHTKILDDQNYEEKHLAVAAHTRGGFSQKKLATLNFLPIQSVLFDRRLYDELGGFDPSRQFLEDWDLWLRYSKRSDFAHLPLVTSLYRTTADPYERIARVRVQQRRAIRQPKEAA